MQDKQTELLNGLIIFINNYNEIDKSEVIKRHARMIIRKVLNTEDYNSEIAGIQFTPSIVAHNIPGFENASTTLHRVFQKGKQELISLIETIKMEIKIDSEMSRTYFYNNSSTHVNNTKKVFVVHGHNLEIKYDVARTLEQLGLEPIILHEQPNKGRTLIKKFTDYSDVDFAIVIISADDYGYSKNNKPSEKKFRARQNVVFELGFFIAKLGFEKVFPLVENLSIEKPGDFDGVMYVSYNAEWKQKLVQELKAVGYEIDANKLF